MTPRIRHALLPALLLAVLLVLGGCAARDVRTTTAKPQQIFARFAESRQAARATTASFSADASMNFASPERSMRVVLDFWGNTEGPLRMDMSAGFGTTGAMWLEDESGLTAYFPLERAVYLHPDARAAAAALGMGIPLSLRDLASMVSGSYDGLVPPGFDSATAAEDGSWTYAFSGPLPVSSMTLDAEGRPMVFAGRLRGSVWRLTASRYGDNAEEPPSPRRFELTMDGGIRAIIRVKRLERSPSPWPSVGLELTVPPGTKVITAEPESDQKS